MSEIQVTPMQAAAAIVEAFEKGDRLPGASPRETLIARIATLICGDLVNLPVSIKLPGKT